MQTVLDYGTEKFAVLSIGENSVNVVVDDELAAKLTQGTQVRVVPEVDKLAIVEIDRGIRLA